MFKCVSVKKKTFRSLNYKANVYHIQADDNETGLSADDREFMDLMVKYFQKDRDGRWKAPLPFRKPRQVLPNNRV